MNIWENYDINDLEGEVWKDVQDWEGMYQVSSLGRFKSLEREKIIGKRGKKIIKSFIMKQNERKGYLSILFYKNNDYILRIPSHIVIAKEFIKNLENKRTVNHINGIKKDNRLENLEWLTDSEQQLHAVKIGLRNNTIGEKSNLCKLNKKIVLEIRDFYNKKIFTVNELSVKYNTAISNVRYIVNRVTWKHI